MTPDQVMRIFNPNIESLLNDIISENTPIQAPSLERLLFPEIQGDIIVVLSHTYIGKDDELGRDLLLHFIERLSDCSSPVKRIIFTHKAVELLSYSSPANIINILRNFHKNNGILMVCEVSAHRLGLANSIRLGRLSETDEICKCILSAWKVIQF